MSATCTLDVSAVRAHFAFPDLGRIVTNNAASTQAPRALLERYRALAAGYENVHRGQSAASRETTRLFEAAYDTIAAFLGAPDRRSIAVVRNATEAINAVMYSLLTEVRDGDNVVTTTLEHNSNYVPWHALCRELLPAFGRRVELRLARFDPATGALDVDDLASLVDRRTKLVCCTGASNFLGTRPPLAAIRELTAASGYAQPDGARGARLLVDGAQLVPGAAVDVAALGIDYLALSGHKLLAPFGAGVLYARAALLETSRPFLYGGDMVADGGVFADRVGYAPAPWRHAAGTPNILGTIVTGDALRLLVDLALSPARPVRFGSDAPLAHRDVEAAMARVGAHCRELTAHALERLAAIRGLRIHGPRDAARRTSLVAFTIAGRDPVELAHGLDARGVEARAGCHCASLAHRALGLDASCRLSFALYNTRADVDRAVDALADVVAPPRSGWPGPRRVGALRGPASTLAL